MLISGRHPGGHLRHRPPSLRLRLQHHHCNTVTEFPARLPARPDCRDVHHAMQAVSDPSVGCRLFHDHMAQLTYRDQSLKDAIYIMCVVTIPCESITLDLKHSTGGVKWGGEVGG